jgi:hypothetical protein
MVLSPFRAQSDVVQKILQKRGDPNATGDFTIPYRFIHDKESIPLFKGDNNIAGGSHDYFCRIDSIPILSKFEAANVYFEFLDYCYDKRPGSYWQNSKEASYKWTKYSVVYLLPGYFFYHKHPVLATAEEIAGVKECYYVDELKEEIKVLESQIEVAKEEKKDSQSDIVDLNTQIKEDEQTIKEKTDKILEIEKKS